MASASPARDRAALWGLSAQTRLAADRLGAERDVLERLAAIVETLGMACVVTEASGVIDDATPAALALFGVDAGCLVGLSLRDLFETSDGQVIAEALRAATAARGAATSLTLRARDERGVLDVRFAALPPAHVLVTLAKAQGEDSVHRALRDTRELFAREREKTAHLARAQSARDRFLAFLSHDLHGPLNAVLGWTRILGDHVLPSSTRAQGLAAIERSVKTALALLEGVLDADRVATGKVPMEIVSVDLGALVRRLVAVRARGAAERGLSLSYSAPRSDELSVFGDPKWLEQIVDCLIANGLRAVENNGGRVELAAFRDGDVVVLRVADTGSGIAPARLTKVFDCESGSDAISPQAVGLYLAKRLVALHEGVITAASDGPGRGATFTVELRARDAPAVAPARGREAERQAALAGVRVLVVDDDADARALASALLGRRGATVLAAQDGETALAMIRSERPDVLVTVLTLPDCEGGHALLAEARRARPDLPAIAVSAFAARNDEAVAAAAGCSRRLSKPFGTSELVEAIQHAIGRGRR